MKYSIVVYSWTGNTTACAVALQGLIGAEPFLLRELAPREGGKGFALGGTQASMGLATKLQALPESTDEDVLLLGMPVWASTTPPAINAFLNEYDLSGKTVYAFATQQSESRPKRLEEKLEKLITKNGGTFRHLFVMRVPRGKRLSPEEASAYAEKWAERIRTGE